MSSSPQAPLARPVLHCVLVSMLHGLFYGYNTGVIGGLSTAVVQQQFGGWQVVNGSETADGAWNCTLAHATPAQIEAGKTTVTSLEGLFTADILFGNFVGALLGPWSANRWGRKVGVAIGAVFATVCPILMALFPSYAAQVVFRTLLGIPLGTACTVGPLYVTEVSPPDRRGKLGTLLQVSLCAALVLGMLVNLIFNPTQQSDCIPDWRWRTQFGLGSVTGVILLFYAVCFMPESPTWLKQKAQRQESGGELSALTLAEEGGGGRGGGGDGGSGWSALCSYKGLKWLLVAICLPACQQLTGINAIIFYGPTIIKNSGFGNSALLLNVLVVGVWNLISVFVSFCLIDRLGRRPLMLGAMATMCVSLIVMGALFHSFPLGNAALGYTSLVMIMLFLLAFESGPGPLFFVIASETFPTSIRNEALALANAFQSVMNILVSFSFPVLIVGLGDPAHSAKGAYLHGSADTFLIFAAVAFLGLVFVYTRLPETKGTLATDIRENTLSKKQLLGDRDEDADNFDPDSALSPPTRAAALLKQNPGLLDTPQGVSWTPVQGPSA